MIRKHYLPVLGGLLFSIVSFAENIERVICRDRSIYEGYISRQESGNTMTILAEKATIVAVSDSISPIIEESVKVSQLSPSWRTWIEQNLPAGTSEVKMQSFIYGGVKYERVYVLEKGVLVTFMDLSKREYVLPWDSVVSTVKSQRPSDEFSGVNDVVTTIDGARYVGQITEQYPGKMIKIKALDGKVYTLSSENLKSVSVEAVNNQMPIWNQVRLLDEITVDGKVYEGIICSREFGHVLSLCQKDGSVKEFPLSKIDVYSKKVNYDYISVKDRIMEEGETYVDNERINRVPLKKQVSGYAFYDRQFVEKRCGDKVCVEFRGIDDEIPVYIVKTESCTEYGRNKRGKEDRSVVERYELARYCDMVEIPIKIARTRSPLGNVKIEFRLLEAGYYLMYIPGQSEGVVIKAV